MKPIDKEEQKKTPYLTAYKKYLKLLVLTRTV